MKRTRGNLEDVRNTVAIARTLGSPTEEREVFTLYDERYKRGRIGYSNSKWSRIPPVILGQEFAKGYAQSEDEYWGAYLTRPFVFRRSPQNEADPNAIVVCTPRRESKSGWMFLGYLSRHIARCLAPVWKHEETACAISGVAGMVQIEIKANCVDRDSNEWKYLKWIEECLAKHKEGTKLADLPMCSAEVQGWLNSKV